MQRYLNTLYVTTQKTYLHKKGETVEVMVNDEVKASIPLITLDSIVCFGNIRLSPFLLASCPQHNVTVSLLSEQGQFLARVQGPVAGNVLLRKAQYRLSDDKAWTAALARTIVQGKIANQRNVLLRAIRDHREKINIQATEKAIERLKLNLRRIEHSEELDLIRGIEGESAEYYFSVFNDMILTGKENFSFKNRNRRPPLDPVNAMLSYGYTLLYHDMISALECSGLDPAVGFLHRDRPGRLSLALDMIEEFRAPVVDRMVLSLINRKEVAKDQFETTASGAVNMNEDARKILITAYQNKKNLVIEHPFLQKKMYLGLLFHTQARLLARFIRGDLDGYPVFFWK